MKESFTEAIMIAALGVIIAALAFFIRQWMHRTSRSIHDLSSELKTVDTSLSTKLDDHQEQVQFKIAELKDSISIIKFDLGSITKNVENAYGKMSDQNVKISEICTEIKKVYNMVVEHEAKIRVLEIPRQGHGKVKWIKDDENGD